MLVVSSVIGSGIFLTPGTVAGLVPHPGAILGIWLLGGLLSLVGALANAELGAMYPRAGGDYVYLREAFHPIAGFLIGWLSFFVIYAGTVATLAVAFADAVAAFLPLGSVGTLVLAIVVTVATSAVNYVGVTGSTRINNVTGYAKLVALAAFALVAPLVHASRPEGLRPLVDGDGLGGVSPAAFGLAFSPVLFTYLGWNAPVYVASEIREPGRNVPRSLFLGLALCTAVYLAVNAVYLLALPLDALQRAGNVGEAAARVLFGPAAAGVVAGLIVVSIFGTLNATVLVGPRIAYAMALDGLAIGALDDVHAVYRTPHRAVVAQAVVAILLVAALRTFPSVLDYTTFAIVLATMADTAALYVLRRRKPGLARPYRAWGYPLLPALYLVVNAAIAGVMLWGRPVECLLGLAVLAAGLPCYAALVRYGGMGGRRRP